MKKILSVILSICMLLSLMPFTAYAIEVDTIPPEIFINTLTRTLPDGKDSVTLGDKVHFSVKLTDDTDIYYRCVTIINTEANKSYDVTVYYNGETDRYEGDFTVSENVPSGIWKIYYVYAEDSNNNASQHYNSVVEEGTVCSDLSAYNFTVTGTNPDVTPPQIFIDTLKRTLPDGKDSVTLGDKVHFSVKLTDDTDIYYRCITIINTEANKSYDVTVNYKSETDLYEGDFEVSENVPSGTWKIYYIYAEDSNNNASNHYNSLVEEGTVCSDLSAYNFTVTGTNPDVTPPEIDIDTLSVSLPQGKNSVIVGDKVHFSVKLTDNTDVYYKCITIINTEANKSYDVTVYYNSETDRYEGDFTVSENVPSGIWKIYYVYAEDSNNNASHHYNSVVEESAVCSDLSAYDFTVAKTCLIIFDTRGGTAVEPIYVEKGTKATAPASPTKDGVQFNGWFKDKDLTKSFYFKYDTVEDDMTLYAGWSVGFSVTNWNKTTSQEREGGTYAVYEPDYKMSGCSNFGTGIENVALDLYAYPDTGYKFVGWYAGVYTGDLNGQSAKPLDLNDNSTLLSSQQNCTLNFDKYSVIVAVFEECTEHNWETFTEKATLTQDGKQYKKCSVCNKEELIKNINKVSIDIAAAAYTYDGKAKTPKVTVTDVNGVLPESEYTVEYLNNINPGTAKVIVTLDKELYNVTKTVEFPIVKEEETPAPSAPTAKEKLPNPFTVKAKKIKLKAKILKNKKITLKLKKAFNIKNAQGKVTFKKVKGNKKITVKKNGKIIVKKGLKKGKYKVKVKVTAAGNDSYNSSEKNVVLKITVK